MKSASAIIISELVWCLKEMEALATFQVSVDTTAMLKKAHKTIKLAEKVAEADTTYKLLEDIVDDADDTGCEDMYTVAACYIDDARDQFRKVPDATQPTIQ